MSNVRLIARLDIKAPNLIKGIHLEGLREIGDPQQFAQAYYAAGADELIYMDIVASLYNRNSLSDIVRRTAEQVFIPITVGGGMRSLDDVEQALRSGADKVAINTAAVARPELITEVATRFGSQCMVLVDRGEALGRGALGGLYRQRPRAHRPRRGGMGQARGRSRRRRDPLDLGRPGGNAQGLRHRADPRGLGCGARAGDRQRRHGDDRAPDRRSCTRATPTRSRWPTCSTTSGFRMADIRKGARAAGIAVREI